MTLQEDSKKQRKEKNNNIKKSLKKKNTGYSIIQTILDNNIDKYGIENFAIFTSENPLATSFIKYGEFIAKFEQIVNKFPIETLANIISEKKKAYNKEFNFKNWDKIIIDPTTLKLWKRYDNILRSKRNANADINDITTAGDKKILQSAVVLFQFELCFIDESLVSNRQVNNRIAKFIKENYDEIMKIMKEPVKYNPFSNANKKIREDLERDLSNYEVTKIIGKYGNLENSFFVYGISQKDTDELSNKYAQKGYIYAEWDEGKQAYAVTLYETDDSNKEFDKILTEILLFYKNLDDVVFVNDAYRIPYYPVKTLYSAVIQDPNIRNFYSQVKGVGKDKNTKFTYPFYD